MMAVPIAIGTVDALVLNTNKSRLCRFVPIAIGTGSGYKASRYVGGLCCLNINAFDFLQKRLTYLRSTIYCEPNIITDSAGKATVWFYAKGRPGVYSGVLQGSDLSGNISVGTITMNVK